MYFILSIVVVVILTLRLVAANIARRKIIAIAQELYSECDGRGFVEKGGELRIPSIFLRRIRGNKNRRLFVHEFCALRPLDKKHVTFHFNKDSVIEFF